MSKRRIYFVFGEFRSPVGGANVILETARLLAEAGYDTAALYCSSSYRYQFAQAPSEGRYHPALRSIRAVPRRLHHRLRDPYRRWSAALDLTRPRIWGKAEPAPGDIIVVPEYCYPEIVPRFPRQHCVVLAQDVFGFVRAHVRYVELGHGVMQDVIAVLTTSRTSAAAVAEIGAPFHLPLALSIDARDFSFTEAKKLQIAYMPRKRAEEAALIATVLRDTPALRDVPLVPIVNLPHAEMVRIMKESLVFLSYSEKEGFGLPPAEAMATGSLVIGYTGVGAQEYFTPDTGFPISDSDITSFVRTIKEVVAEYRASPERLDAFRRGASRFILDKFDRGVATRELLVTWERLETYIDTLN
jgi:glycosyltransferase involved in cell wall biosynthesis